jgi:hypothetical protein
MSEENKNVGEDVIEVPVTKIGEVVEEKDPNLLDLQDVGYMVMVGRTKDGETFFRTVGVSDLIVVRGLVEYARDEVKHEFSKHFKISK